MGRGLPTRVMPPSERKNGEKKNEGRRRGKGRLGHLKKMEKKRKKKQNPKGEMRRERRERRE